MKKSKGFTLGELLVVVAILGILTSVSIPIFSGKLSETEETVCLTNQASLKHVLVIRQMFGMGSDLESYYNQIKDEYKCPSKDGQIVCSISGDEIIISCTKHGDADPVKIFKASLDKLEENKYTYFSGQQSRRIDSEATGTNLAGATKELKNYIQGSALENINVKSWAVIKSSGTFIFVWSEVDISDTQKTYGKIPAIGYDESTKEYIVGLTSVVKSKTYKYNIIAPGAEKDSRFNPTGAEKLNSLSQAQAKYNELMEEYNNNN